MRSVALLLFLIALYNLGRGLYEQNSDAATIEIGRRPIAIVKEVNKAEDPERFKAFLANRWARTVICLVGGFIVLGIARRVDADDPFSPDLGADVKEKPIDPTLEEELRKRRSGLR